MKFRKKYPSVFASALTALMVSGCNLTSSNGSKNNEQEAPDLTFSEKCEALINAGLENTTALQSEVILATESSPTHCSINGNINQRTSPIDGQTYAIKFNLRLPEDWNKRFYYAGGGGSDGNIASLQSLSNILSQGYAIVSTDSGHDNAENTSEVAATYQFGYDHQARIDYGYNGPAQATEKAKELSEIFYEGEIEYSYFVGCSEGGREGLMFSQRYPNYFDGIVSGNPGMDLAKVGIASAWNNQAFAEAARDITPFGNPDLTSSFTDAELETLGDAILAACDSNDGLTDGMVFNPQACEFDPATLGPTGTGELSAVQVTALNKVFSGAKNTLGEELYSGYFWDPGVAAFGWRQWMIGPLFPGFPAPGNSAINTTLSGGATAFIFTSPPNSMTNGTALAAGSIIETSNPLGQEGTEAFGDAYVPWLLGFNMDTDAPKIFAETPDYPESPMDFMRTSETDYTEFSENGGKLLVYTGQADPIFSAKYHLNWYDELIEANDGLDKTRSFARLFLVPGMNHCGGGPATGNFDTFETLVNWVERDQVPTKLIATASDDTPWPGRTRPLCSYPEQARYKGEGSIEEAENFTCGLPSL